MLPNRGASSIVALGAVLLNGLLSLLLIFALSPILEITFHYTTRFRLMELMNLEQPLLFARIFSDYFRG